MQPLAVITNHRSTRNVRDRDWIAPFLNGEQGVHHFAMDRIDDIPGIIARCADAGAETIVVNGGDGTAGLIFNALLNDGPYARLPAVALLPAGKTNMSAAGWSVPGTKERAIAAVLKHRRDGTLATHVREQRVLALHRGGNLPPLHGAFFGAADVVEGILFCRRHIYPLALPNTISHALAITVLLGRCLLTGGHKMNAMPEGLGATGENGAFFMVAATALDELILGVRPESSDSNDGMHYLSLRAGLSALRALPQILRGRVSSGTGRTVRRTDRLTLRFNGAYTLDGEIYQADERQPLTVDSRRRLPFVRLAPT